MAKTPKLMPNLDQKTTKLINLTVLQRADPSVEEILMTATHVTFYQFNVDSSQWSRKDVEGSLFVVKRNGQPRFQFIVMNRLNTDNMVENLLGDFEYEVQVPYLLYRNSSQEVIGIWFYNSHECEEIANLFGRIFNTYPKMPAKPKMSPSGSEFEDVEVVPTRATMEDPLGPSSFASSNVPDVPDDQSFMSLFHNAMKIGSTPNTAISGQMYHASATIVPTSPQIVNLPTLPSAQLPATLSTSTPILPILEKIESNSGMRRSADLVTPSSLIMPPVTSSVLTVPPMNPQGNSKPYGVAPLLQPFPPPQSVTPPFAVGPVISRDKVREALQMLVQDNQFIDMVYQAVVNAHHS